MVRISELLTVLYCFNTTLLSYTLNGRNYEHLITAQNHFHVHGSILNLTLLCSYVHVHVCFNATLPWFSHCNNKRL